MSLYSLIRDGADVRQGFAARLLRPSVKFDRGLQAPPLTTNYQFVGGAFDYLLRFFLQRINPHARVAPWVAERGVEVITLGQGVSPGQDVPTISRHPRRLRAAAYLADAKRQHRTYLENGQVTENLLIAAHRLAHLDVAFRAGPDSVDWRSINYLSSDDAADLKALLQLVDEKTFRTSRACLLKPRLRAAELVGGADPDLILDNCLVDVTTTKLRRVDVRDVHQLVASWLLLGLGGIAHENGKVEQCPVTSIGIYFSRFGLLWKVPVEQMLPASAVPDLTRWFVDTACASNKVGPELLRALRGPLAGYVSERNGTLIPGRKN